MNTTTAALTELFNRIPRRHTSDNVKDIYLIVDEYEEILKTIEAIDAGYEKEMAVFFDDLETVRAAVKKSTDNKASKKNKDSFFDDASVALKDSMEALIKVYADGSRQA